MKSCRADLHVHTVLSPCAEVEMIPPLIVESALALELDLIAITDHNSSANVAAVQQAAFGTSLTVLPGMELQTLEEIHSLCLFETLDALLDFQDLVDAALPAVQNQPEHFGEQFVVDASGEFIRREERLLIISTRLSLEDALNEVHKRGGLFIPAHINRKAFGMIETLGFVPTGQPYDALEVSRHLSPGQAAQSLPGASAYPLLQNGDAHRLEELLGTTTFVVNSHCQINEFKLALKGLEGRSFSVRERRISP